MSTDKIEPATSIGGVNADASAGTTVLTDVRTDGPCLQRTLPRLGLPGESLAAIREQSIQLLSQVVHTYKRDVAAGEVGMDGSGVASGKVSKQGFGPTGLMYGRIQSGKTAAMITFSALALDNKFRIIVVLTTNFVELVSQTADRFSSVARALVHSSTQRNDWEDDVDNIRKNVGKCGLVIVCAKEARHLQSVLDLIKHIGGPGYPAIILDDEADQATLDANTRKRARATDGGEVAQTKIHKRVADIRSGLPHHVFIQVTATPYALLLQNVDNALRPKFTHILEAGPGYTGGKDFFSDTQLRFDEDMPTPPVIYVEENESDELQTCEDTPPEGFENAIAFYLVSAAVQILNDPTVFNKSQNFLCHTSHKKSEHDRISKLLRRFLSNFEDQLESGEGRAVDLVHAGCDELRKTIPELPPVEDIIEDIVDRLPRRRIRVINSEGKGTTELAGVPNFIIGGNIVGRGLTIPNLLVTYYLRKPKLSQMDTMLQHARMFGYREPLMPYTRIFLPRSLAVRFHSIHLAEEDLRRQLRNSDSLSAVPIQVVGQLRATRYGVLDTGSVASLNGGSHVYPYEPPYNMAAKRLKLIGKLYHEIFKDDFTQLTNPKDESDRRYAKISVELAGQICRAFQQSDWNGTFLSQILEASWSEVIFRFRPMNRSRRPNQTSTDFPTGVISGDELKEARNSDLPTLFLFRQIVEHHAWNNQNFWYPTLVFPSKMRNIVYNATPEE